MTNTSPPTLSAALEAFLQGLVGKNRSEATLRAYRTDLHQLLTWLRETNVAVSAPADVTKADLSEYLAELGRRRLTGVSRARKLAAIREFFRFCEGAGLIAKSPAAGLETPKREKPGRAHLRPDEYSRMLALAGGSPRDYAILQVFLQTGVRVSELCDLRLEDVDLTAGVLKVRAGKGMVAREIELEAKGIKALKNWLAVRPDGPYPQVFLNQRDAAPITERGVRMLVTKYKDAAGITKQASCHSLRHTFATHKAEAGVSPFQLQQWLGHANLNTTQIYVHHARKNAKKVMRATSL
jgi:integrase/recombinase XerC